MPDSPSPSAIFCIFRPPKRRSSRVASSTLPLRRSCLWPRTSRPLRRAWTTVPHRSRAQLMLAAAPVAADRGGGEPIACVICAGVSFMSLAAATVAAKIVMTPGENPHRQVRCARRYDAPPRNDTTAARRSRPDARSRSAIAMAIADGRCQVRMRSEIGVVGGGRVAHDCVRARRIHDGQLRSRVEPEGCLRRPAALRANSRKARADSISRPLAALAIVLAITNFA